MNRNLFAGWEVSIPHTLDSNRPKVCAALTFGTSFYVVGELHKCSMNNTSDYAYTCLLYQKVAAENQYGDCESQLENVG